MITQIGQDIIASLSKPIAIENGTTTVGASIGASLWQTEMVPHTAIERADQALYRSKANGKHQITLDESLT